MPEIDPDTTFARGILSAVEIGPCDHEPPFAWPALFGNDHPIEIEIGCGKGRFLVFAANGHPGVNFIGVERAGKYYRRAVAAVAKAGLANVRLMRVDGLDLLDRWVPAHSAARVHIYFPDPWPKKRHHKRRVFRPGLLDLAARALVESGEFRVATDHVEYGVMIRDLFAQDARFVAVDWAAMDELPTHYAAKWERDGRDIWRGCYRFTG